VRSTRVGRPVFRPCIDDSNSNVGPFVVVRGTDISVRAQLRECFGMPEAGSTTVDRGPSERSFIDKALGRGRGIEPWLSIDVASVRFSCNCTPELILQLHSFMSLLLILILK
jgi:hypothetical protein